MSAARKIIQIDKRVLLDPFSKAHGLTGHLDLEGYLQKQGMDYKKCEYAYIEYKDCFAFREAVKP